MTARGTLHHDVDMLLELGMVLCNFRIISYFDLFVSKTRIVYLTTFVLTVPSSVFGLLVHDGIVKCRFCAVLSGYVRSPERCGFYDALGAVDEGRLAGLLPPGEVRTRTHSANASGHLASVETCSIYFTRLSRCVCIFFLCVGGCAKVSPATGLRRFSRVVSRHFKTRDRGSTPFARARACVFVFVCVCARVAFCFFLWALFFVGVASQLLVWLGGDYPCWNSVGSFQRAR